LRRKKRWPQPGTASRHIGHLTGKKTIAEWAENAEIVEVLRGRKRWTVPFPAAGRKSVCSPEKCDD
jgi:hypothetical protein